MREYARFQGCHFSLRIPSHPIFHRIFHEFSDAPRLELRLGRTLNASNLKENDDVYFECAVDARPTPKEIEWSHNVSAYSVIRQVRRKVL